jgi:hypothetical protein
MPDQVNGSPDHNFHCLACGQTWFVPKYSFIIKPGPNQYVDGSKRPIQCPDCCSADVETVQRKGELINVAYGAYSSASPEDKQLMLRKRAKLAMRKDAEQRHEIETNFRGRVNQSHY